ncbi:MAG: substrate-binding domain-containing protein [Planctomycetota bacterium]
MPKHIYETIAENLLSRISANEFNGGKLPSQRALADHYRTTPVTMKKAMRLLIADNAVVLLGTSGYYVSETAVRARAPHRTVLYLLAGRAAPNTFHSGYILSLEAVAKRRGLSLLVSTAVSAADVKSAVRRHVERHSIDGILLTGLYEPSMASYILSRGVPLVCSGYPVLNSPRAELVDKVVTDCSGIAADATRRLTHWGHTSIALVNGPSSVAFDAVCQGYLSALNDVGIAYRETLIERCETDTRVCASRATERLLRRASPTAIVAATDELAYGVIDSLKKNNLRIPDDVSVIGSGDGAPSSLMSPALSTYALDKTDLSERVLELLDQRMNGLSGKPKTVLMPIHFVSRDSAGRCLRTRKKTTAASRRPKKG